MSEKPWYILFIWGGRLSGTLWISSLAPVVSRGDECFLKHPGSREQESSLCCSVASSVNVLLCFCASAELLLQESLGWHCIIRLRTMEMLLTYFSWAIFTSSNRAETHWDSATVAERRERRDSHVAAQKKYELSVTKIKPFLIYWSPAYFFFLHCNSPALASTHTAK